MGRELGDITVEYLVYTYMIFVSLSYIATLEGLCR
jgi:hypothetical protein